MKQTRSATHGGLDTARTDAEELKNRLIRGLAWTLVVSSGIGWTTVGAASQLVPARFHVFLILFAIALLALLFHRWWPRVAQVILLVGPSLALVMAIIMLESPALSAFAALIVMLNAVVNPLFGLLAAILNTVTLYVLVSGTDHFIPSLVLLWSAAVIQWIFARGLFTALDWAWDSQQRASELLGDVRRRRGELRRTLASLTESSRRLERTRHELAIARQQAEEARHIKAQFAANISHELRTPLNLIIGFSEMMYRTPEVYGEIMWPPALRADTREIYRSARHLMDMVDDILDLARIEADRLPLTLEATDLKELILEALATVSGLLRDKDVQLETSLPSELPTMLVDRARIRQVLVNLLNNAIRFTDQGRIVVGLEKDDEKVTVSVVDTGVGIPDDQLSTLFEVFGQPIGPIASGRGGAGLGLAICKQFVLLHGGHIEAESEVGRGSVFRFDLPLPGSDRTLSQLSYYAPEGWAPLVAENPLEKVAIVITPDAELGRTLIRGIPGYRALPVSELEGLVHTVESEHPAGIVFIQEPFAETPLNPETVWRAAGRNDLPIVCCEVPMAEVAIRELGISEYLVKPIRADQLVPAIKTARAAPQKFLLVDDDPGFVSLLDRMLHAEFIDADVRRAYTGEEAIAALGQESFDVLLLDLALPEMSGLDVIRKIRGQGQSDGPAIIVITGLNYAEEVARLRPARIELMRRDGHGRMGDYVSAVLCVEPPDYSRSAPLERHSEPLAETLAF